MPSLPIPAWSRFWKPTPGRAGKLPCRLRVPMSYRIKIGEGLAAAFGRIAAEEMDLAVAELRRPDRGEAVHNARKSLKRLRALLRSLRVAFPKKLFRAENRRIAAAGRKISPMRDVHVQLRALVKLN